MRVLQIGLGSMGRRRLRNFKAIGGVEVTGFDLQEKRRREAGDVATVESLTDEEVLKHDAVIVSTPPDRHLEPLRAAVRLRRPVFVEASVLLDGLEQLSGEAKRAGVLVAPSCTMRFHPSVAAIKGIVGSGKYGKLCNFVYHSGQYLPDWHPWEDIRQFYAGRRQTSGSREIVTFEWTWLLDVVGIPRRVQAFFGKTHEMGVDIDDTYLINMDFGGSFGALIVDVVSRFATRSLVLNLERAQLRWNWEEGRVRLYDAANRTWSEQGVVQGSAADGYNANIVERMYVDEMVAFLAAVRGEAPFPNTLEDDIAILKLLQVAEGAEARG